MTKNKLKITGILAALTAGFILSGCGNTTSPESTGNATTNEDHGHEHAPGEDAHAHEGDEAHGHSHDDSADREMIAKWFPGATVNKKPFPFGTEAAAHLSEESKLKFTGKEGDWGIYEAVKDGQREGFAVMTHADIPGGEEMHVDFAVDKKFIVTKTDIAKAPDEAKMSAFTAQFKGKKLSDAWQVGKDLKPTPGLPAETSQIAADTVKKGLAILDANFNAAHGHSHSAPHDESKPHTHGEEAHDESKPHSH